MKRVKGQHLFYWVDSVTESLGCEQNKLMCWMFFLLAAEHKCTNPSTTMKFSQLAAIHFFKTTTGESCSFIKMSPPC